jgi:phosphopentomutase
VNAYQPLQRRHELCLADVDALDDAAVEHRGRHTRATALALGLGEHVQDDALEARQAIADVGQAIVVMHG